MLYKNTKLTLLFLVDLHMFCASDEKNDSFCICIDRCLPELPHAKLYICPNEIHVFNEDPQYCDWKWNVPRPCGVSNDLTFLH